MAATNTSRAVSVEAYYAEAEEDAEFTAYTGRAVAFAEDPDHGQEQSHPSLSGSGYNSVRVVWQDNDDSDVFSPWECSVRDTEAPERPRLSDNDKKIIRRALDIVKGLPNVDAFRHPVNERRYSDYRTRVEVPMDLTFIANRLETDYYSTKYGVVADMRLIQTNCAKYNGDHDDLTELAAQLVATFEENVFDDEAEKAYFHQYDAPTSGAQEALEDNANDATASGSSLSSALPVVRQRSQRQRRPPRSVLEDVMGETEESRQTRSSRTGRSSRPASRRASSRLQETENSVLMAVAQPDVAPTLEQLSNGRVRGRSTRARQNNRREATQARNMPQRAARAGLRNSIYRDVPSDVDEETDQSPQASPHRRTSRRTNTTTSHRSLRAGLRNSGVQQAPSSSDEDVDELNMQPQAWTSSSRTTRRPAAQEPPRRPRLRIRAPRQSEPADDADDELAESSADDAESSPSQRSASRRSSRRSPRGSRRAAASAPSPENESPPSAGRSRNRSKRRKSNDTDDASFDEERGDDESDFEGSNGNEDSAGDDDDISVEASSDSESEIVNTRSSRTRKTRQRAIEKEEQDESSVGSAPITNSRSRNRRLEAPQSPFRSSHVRSTQRKRTSYVVPSESEFESDVDSPELTAPRPKQRKTSHNSKKRGLSVSFCSISWGDVALICSPFVFQSLTSEPTGSFPCKVSSS